MHPSLALLALAFAPELPAAAPPLSGRDELSRAIERVVADKIPREWEDLSEWNRSIPMPETFRFPRLRRGVVRKDGQDELAHGTWKRTKVWLDDPARDVRVRVLDARKVDASTTRLRVRTTVAGHGERHRQGWRRGLKLLDLNVQADATVAVTLDCDVKVAVDVKQFPPALSVSAKVTDAKLDLEAFELRRVGPVEVRLNDELAEELRGFLASLLKAHEAEVKEFANREIARGLQGLGQGTAGLKLLAPR